MKKSELASDVIRWLIAVVVSVALIFASTTAYNAFKPAEPDEVLTGAAQGLLSEVTVSIGIKDGVIMSAEAAEAGETPELGGAAIAHYNADYLPTLIGKTVEEIDPSVIDTVSGATVTSNAFIDALKQAAGIVEEEPVVEEAPAEEAAAAEGDTLTGSAQGMMGEVTVKLTVSDGVITSAVVEGASETPALGGAMMDGVNAGYFTEIVGSAPADVDPSKIDVVSGSTVTSNAVIEALTQAIGSEAPAEEAAAEPATATGKPYTGTARGIGDVTVTLTVDNGIITSAVVEGASETPALGGAMIDAVNTGYMTEIVGSAPADVDPSKIDVVSGCTLTTNAVIEALTQAVAAAAPAEEAAAEEAPAEETPAEETAPAEEAAAETLTGSAKGIGDITVTLTVSDGVITSAVVEGASETPALGGAMMDGVNAGYFTEIVGSAPADVDPSKIDVVSGSTVTSNAVIEALTQAIGK